MTGISKKTKEKFELIRKLLTEGKKESEIVELLSNIYKVIPRTQYRIIKSYYTQMPTTQKTIKAIGGLNNISKKIICNGYCYFCLKNNNLIEHHLSYNPEVLISLCQQCHSKLHFLIKDYHNNNLEKDKIITYYTQLIGELNRVMAKMNNAQNDTKSETKCPIGVA
jgi:hypothetical protein